MIRHVELLTVRSAEAGKALLPADARGWPRGAKAVEFRPLPWPFRSYASISSDCDSGNFNSAARTLGYLREVLGLPVGDSYFPDLLCCRPIPYRPQTKPEDIQRLVGEQTHEDFVAWAGDYVRKAHLGWFDTVHGFLSAHTVKLPEALDEPATPEATDAASSQVRTQPRLWRLTVESENRSQKMRFRFKVPKGWNNARPPRYVLLSYTAPLQKTLLSIHVHAGDAPRQTFRGTTAFKGTPLIAPNWYVIDLWPSIGVSLARLQAVEVEVEMSGPVGVYVDLHDVLLTSNVVSDIEQYARTLQRYNLTVSVFTSHGAGLVFAPSTAASDAAADPRRLVDLRQNAFYSVAQIRDFGIRFFTSYSNTSSTTVMPIGKLAFTNSLNDGTPIYDFYRYIFSPKTLDAETLNTFWNRSGRRLIPSLVDMLGIHIAGLLMEMDGHPFCGGLIYTHLYVTNRPLEGEDLSWFEQPFNSETRTSLSELSERFYNPNGDIEPSQRIMIAPVPTLLRLSSILQQIEGHAYYDEVANEIHVEPWFDPVQSEWMPSTTTGFRELRALTFYVNDSHSAKLSVAGVPYSDLIRNPPDEAGQASITVADGSAPFVLLGKVPLSKTHAEVALTGAKLKQPDLKPDAAPAGDHQLVLTSGKATLSVKPVLASLANYQALRLEFIKSNTATRIGLRLRLSSGLEIALAEKGLGLDDPHVVLEPWSSTEPRVVVVPFYHLVETAVRRADGEGPGLGHILSWELVVSSMPGQKLTVASLRLLRDCDRPEAGGGVVVGGQCGPGLGVLAVRMNYAGHEYEEKVAPNGIYIFSRKVERGSIVEIFGVDREGREIEPANGRFVEILTDKTDIDLIPPPTASSTPRPS